MLDMCDIYPLAKVWFVWMSLVGLGIFLSYSGYLIYECFNSEVETYGRKED